MGENNFSQELQNNQDKYSTDYQQSVYQNIETTKIMKASNYLFWGFYAILILLSYFLYLEPIMSYKIKLLILAAFALYPFYIYMLEKMVYYMIKYIYSLFTGKVFAW
jgi:hypothetical protein